MQSKLTAALRADVKAELVDKSLAGRLGLAEADLYGAVQAAAEALQAGDLDRAFRGFAYLVVLDPTNPTYHIGLANVALGLEQFAIALQSASVVVASRPRSAEGYHLSARACLGMGEPALALEDLAEVERLAQEAGQAEWAVAAQKLRVLVAGVGQA